MTEGQVSQKTAGTEDSRDRRAADSGSRESGAAKFNFVGRSFDGWNWQSADSVNAWTDGGRYGLPEV
jgi:hypothetical protein